MDIPVTLISSYICVGIMPLYAINLDVNYDGKIPSYSRVLNHMLVGNILSFSQYGRHNKSTSFPTLAFFPHIKICILKKQIKGVPSSSFGIGGIFLHSFLTSLTLIDEGHRKVRTPYDESKKILNDPI
ncbi:transmembrane protein, putative [Medicago truncatula]|uniref:Transmembrane protein, putative n=1 Tax=Medicago truncatula TaxID=3880 RepID=A0A072VDD4_MEDTR|nr:transmembrane protein, putative [Medicago truncatula]